MTKQLFDRLLKDTKQALIDIQAGETRFYTRFRNNQHDLFVIASSGGYSIIYDNCCDKMIVAWSVRLVYKTDTFDEILDKTCLIGDWGQGYYFDNNGGNDLVERYDLVSVVELFIKKALS